ncbi:MAG: hypothetical protein Fues2KO_28080 [Fuerstiella sp.]
MMTDIHGVLPILHTPFDDDDNIDREDLQREIDWAFEQNITGVCSAMVSEVLRLTTAERIQLNRWIVELTDGRGLTIASVGAESTKQAVQFATAAAEAGCSALMAIPPVTTALPVNELWDYFSTLADCVDVPLVVQDASSYVGAAIPTTFYVRLLDEYGPQKILFKPEGSPIGPNISALRDASDGRARMFDGSGGLLLVDAFRRGVSGTMPGVDLLHGIAPLWHALKRGDETAANRLYFPICALAALEGQAGLDGYLAVEKYILKQRGLFKTDHRRRPYSWSLDSETQAEVDRQLQILDAEIQAVARTAAE